jgi:CheY-like chemotaxis protein
MMETWGRRKRILVADDEAQNLELLEACLEPLGHETVRASTGIEAIALLERLPIDLVLLDVMMPGATGFEVLRRFRERPTDRCIPVVVLTALVDRAMRLRGLELGANDFLPKPIDRAELIARVRTLLNLQDANDALLERTRELTRLQAFQRYLVNYLVRDLRKPLSVVRNNLASLRAARIGKALVPRIDEARTATDRMHDMIAELIDAAKMEDSGERAGSSG